MMRALPIGIFFSLVLRQWPHGIWWVRSAVLGFLNIGLFFVLLFVAATRLPGGITAIIGAIQPLIVIALAWIILKERPTTHKLGFAILGLAGVALLVFTQTAQLDRLGVLAILSATLSMTCGTVLTKKWGRPVPLISFTAWQLVAGGIVLLPVALIVEGVPSILTARNGLGFIYLGTVNTGLAYTLWFRGIVRLPATTMPMLGLLSPVVAITLGYVLLQQQLELPQIFGAMLVLGSVVVGQRIAKPAQS
ncbi:MAG: EamA family transporter [Chloroflexota bacterium]